MMRPTIRLVRALRPLWLSICVSIVLTVGSATLRAADPAPVPSMMRNMANPESAAVGPGGLPYVSVIGERDKDGDGMVVVFDGGKTKPIVTGLDDPKGIAFHGNTLYIADKQRVWKVEFKKSANPKEPGEVGKPEVYAAAKDFPGQPPHFLNDLAIDAKGSVYVSDSGQKVDDKRVSIDGAIYRISGPGKVTKVTGADKHPEIVRPNGIMVDDAEHLLLMDMGTGVLYRVKIADGSLAKLADGFQGGDGLARDRDGNLYLSEWTTGELWLLPADGSPRELLSKQFQSAADISINAQQALVLVPDMKAGTLTALPLRTNVPRDIDQSPLPVKVERAFPHLTFDRPLIITHAGDGTNRVFVGAQRGKIHVFANDQEVSASTVFLDFESKVLYADSANEEGFLGLAFHPKYKENGEFFIYYTDRRKPEHVSVISRFRVSKDDPNKADPTFEEVVLTIPQPYWNHNGGTIAFGPDGYLYVGLGDGGSANDPHGNGQKMDTLLGKILRIDVDRKDSGLGYAVPKDNPFVGKPGVRPEIWASGVRNIWRMAFDSKTGTLWAADVGQNAWEEINIIVRGGNYGWSLREAMHKFKDTGSAPRADLIEPVWEYHHNTGKSITGGGVYRGKRLPALAGLYVYGDYVSGLIWGLNYDQAKKKLLSNRPIAGNVNPIMSFGEDETGEMYYATTGGMLYRFVASDAKQPATSDTGAIQLFDGQSLDGWRAARANESIDGSWVVEPDGSLYCLKRGPNLVTDKEYGDFDLSLEWKIAKGANSGVKYRVRKYDGPTISGDSILGCEYQMIDELHHKNALVAETSTGSLYHLYAPDPKKEVKPMGQWNQSRIVVRGNKFEHWLNGKKVVQADASSDDWKKRLAASKFAPYPDFSQQPTGLIMLTNHGGGVWFRNIVLTPLDGDKAASK